MPKYLLLGKNGLLGSAFSQELTSSSIDFVELGSAELDLTDFKMVESYLKLNQFDVVINCTGYNFVDKAEENSYEEELCFKINAKAPANIAKILSENNSNCRFIQFSTDYVFDGKNRDGYDEDSVKNPLNVYGKSKDLMENLVLDKYSLSSIFRVSWLFGPNKANFVSKIVDKLNSDTPLEVVSNQFGMLTYTCDVANQVLNYSASSKKSGVFHLCNSGDGLSWFEIAEFVAKVLKSSKSIKPIRIEELNLLAKRPKYSILRNNKFDLLPVWQQSVENYIKQYCL